MSTAAQGVRSKFLIDQLTTSSGDTPDWSTATRIALIRESVKKFRRVIRPRGIYGTRAVPSEIATKGATVISGRIVVDITPNTLTTWLPLVFGSSSAPTEQLPYFSLYADRVSKVFQYNDLKVNRARFSGVGGPRGDAELLTLEVEVIGTSSTLGPSAPDPFPSFSLDAAYTFCESDFETAQSTSQPTFQWLLYVDNDLNPRYVSGNSHCGPTDISEGDRIILFRGITPYTSTEAGKFTNGLQDPSAFTQTARLKFEYGNVSTQFDFPAMQYDTNDPVVNGKGEITLQLNGQAAGTSLGDEVSITHDATP